MTESSLIQTIEKLLGKSNDKNIIAGIGDDCAVVGGNTKDKYLLYTCDSLVSDVHFRKVYMTAQQIGYKAVCVSVSDIAAMGGRPLYCLVSLHLPKTENERYGEMIIKGVKKACLDYGVYVIGGNISGSDQIIIDVFVIGEVDSSKLLLRNGASPGELVFTTGVFGDSAAGLFLLEHPEYLSKIRGGKQLITKHISPTPKIKEASVLADLTCVTSMIDVSDGLSTDIIHICDKSNTGVFLFTDKVPISKPLQVLSSYINRDPLSFSLTGGEDYELCFTAPSDKADHIMESLKKVGSNASIIGKILPKKEGRWIQGKSGKTPLIPKGWDHYR